MAIVPTAILQFLRKVADLPDRSPVEAPAPDVAHIFPESVLWRGLDIDAAQVSSVSVINGRLVIEFDNGGRLEFLLNAETISAFSAFAGGSAATLVEMILQRGLLDPRDFEQIQDELPGEFSTGSMGDASDFAPGSNRNADRRGLPQEHSETDPNDAASGFGFGTPLEIGVIGESIDALSGLNDEIPNAGLAGPAQRTFAEDADDTGSPAALASGFSGATPNRAPVGVPDVAITREDTPLTLDVLANDTDLEGDTLSVSAVTDGANGTTVINPDGTVTYTPGADFFGSDSFTYTVSDGQGGSSTATVDITVSPVADTPNVSASDASGQQDNAVPISIPAAIGALTGLAGFELVVSAMPAEARLSAGTDNGDGSWTLTAGDLPDLHFIPAPGSSAGVQLSLNASVDQLLNVLNGSFTLGDEGFAYSDDAFRGTSEPAYATGAWGPLTGQVAGGLGIMLGGVNGRDINDMSGGWSKQFTVTEQTQGTLTFSYNLTMTSQYEANEYSQVLVSVDGNLVGTNGNDYVDQISGGSGRNDFTTGWQTVTIDLGQLDPGTHTITLGGYNNQKTTRSEQTTIRFDDVALDVAGSQSTTDTVSTGEPGIAIDVAASLNDTSGSETLEITISGLPAGAQLSAGTDNGDGSWTLAPGELAGLRLSPPPGYAGDMALTATATATDGADTASTSANFTVSVSAVDLPVLANDDVDYGFTGGLVTTGNVVTGVDLDADPRLQGSLEADVQSNQPAFIRAVQHDGVTYTLAPDGLSVSASDGGTAHVFNPLTGTLAFTTAGSASMLFAMTGPAAGEYSHASASLGSLLPGMGLNGEVYETSSLGNLAQVEAIIDSSAPTARFNATTIDYGPGASNMPLSAFLGPDSGSLTGAQSNPLETMAFRISGFIQLDSGTHDFSVYSDDGFSLRIDGRTVTEHFNNRAPGTSSGSIDIAADGVYSIEIIYWENGGQQVLNVTSSITGGGTLGGGILYAQNPLAPVDETFQYTLEDGDGDTSTATLTIDMSDPSAPATSTSLGDVDHDGNIEHIVYDPVGAGHFALFGPADPDVVDVSTIGGATPGFEIDEIHVTDSSGATTVQSAPDQAQIDQAAAYFRGSGPAGDTYVLVGQDQSGQTHILGGHGDDDIIGTSGSDVIYTGSGDDSMTGGAGSDRFVLSRADLGTENAITDFEAGAGGDVLDLSDVLADFDQTVDNLADWVELQDDGSDTIVSVDVNGTAGGTSFESIVSVQGLTGVSLDDLLQDNNLLIG